MAAKEYRWQPPLPRPRSTKAALAIRTPPGTAPFECHYEAPLSKAIHPMDLAGSFKGTKIINVVARVLSIGKEARRGSNFGLSLTRSTVGLGAPRG
eukprot:6582439-Pyramimonas_sp.AAC.2